MKKAQGEAAADTVKDAENAPYKFTPEEAKAIEAYRAKKERRGPRLKVTSTGKNLATINVDHADNTVGTVVLMRAIGTTDVDFLHPLLCQIVDASKASESGANFMLSVIKGIEPRDQIEAMLAAQMAAVHMASMTFARRLAHVENIPEQDSAGRAFNKLTRTFSAQMSALKEYRSKGEQKMTVQHVHVAEGGQAIVGNVNAPAKGVGARKKIGGSTPCIGLCTRRRDAARGQSGAGYSAERRRLGATRSAGCTGQAAALLEETATH